MKMPAWRTSTYFLLAAFFILLPKFTLHYKGATGMLLVAEPGMPAPFGETVLYIEDHTLGHALGFIVNRPLTPGAPGYPRRVPEGMEGKPVYYGGPVGFPDTVFFMYRSADGDIDIGPDKSGEPYALVLGYAGWTVMQLNFEMMRKRWNTIPYDPALLFETASEDVWSMARRRVLQDKPLRSSKNIL